MLLCRLTELNAIRQVFNVCSSPVVQSAWDQGQTLSVHGLAYSVGDGLLKVTSSHNYCLHAPACCPVTIRPSLTPCTPYNCTQLGSWHIFPLSATAWLDITVTCAAYDLSLFAAATADTLGTTLLPCLLKHPVFLSSLCSCLHSHDLLHVHNIERHFHCSQAFLSLYSHCELDVTPKMWAFLNRNELLLSSVAGADAANHWVQQSCKGCRGI